MPPPLEENDVGAAQDTPAVATTETAPSTDTGLEHVAMSRPTQQKRRNGKKVAAFKASPDNLWDD